MKHIIIALLTLLAPLAAMAQVSEFKIDESSLSVVDKESDTRASLSSLKTDSNKRACARIKLRISNLIDGEIEYIKVVASDNTLIHSEIAPSGDGFILDLVAGERVALYLRHNKIGISNTVLLQLESGKIYRLDAKVESHISLTVRCNTPKSNVYIDGVHKGVIGAGNTLTLNSIARGKHQVKVECSELSATENIELTSSTIFRLDIPYAKPGPHKIRIQAKPFNASLVIDGVTYRLNEHGVAEVMLQNGLHDYTVTAENYRSESGSFFLNGEPTNLDINLYANFGWLSIPATGALEGSQVYVDDNYIGKTPIVNKPYFKGRFKVRIIKDMYKPYEGEFEITDNTVLTYTPELDPDFAEVVISSAYDAFIYVDNHYKAKGSWSGKLRSGTHTFEARKSNHRSYSLVKNIQPTPTKQDYTITSPTPIYGGVKLTSKPSRANIYLDGNYVGQTPYTAQTIIGEHKFSLYKKRYYNSNDKAIYITEGETKSEHTRLYRKPYVPQHPYYTWERVSIGIMTEAALAFYDDSLLALGIGMNWRLWSFNSYLVPVVGLRYMIGFDGSHAFGFPISFNFNLFGGGYEDISLYTGLGIDPMCLIYYDYAMWDCPITWNILGIGGENYDIYTYLNYGFTIPDNIVWGTRFTYYF